MVSSVAITSLHMAWRPVYFASTQYSMLQTRTSICALENTCINYRFFKCTERGLLRTVLSTCHEISDGRNDASR